MQDESRWHVQEEEYGSERSSNGSEEGSQHKGLFYLPVTREFRCADVACPAKDNWQTRLERERVLVGIPSFPPCGLVDERGGDGARSSRAEEVECVPSHQGRQERPNGTCQRLYCAPSGLSEGREQNELLSRRVERSLCGPAHE